MTLEETPFDAEIAQGVESGALCPKPLTHGSTTLCGRPVDTHHGVGLCQWHSEVELKIPHEGDVWVQPKHPCTVCGWREIAWRALQMCNVCKRAHVKEIKESMVVTGSIVESRTASGSGAALSRLLTGRGESQAR